MGAVERSENTDGSLASLITVTQKTRNDRSTDTGGNRTRLLAFIDIIHDGCRFIQVQKIQLAYINTESPGEGSVQAVKDIVSI